MRKVILPLLLLFISQFNGSSDYINDIETKEIYFRGTPNNFNLNDGEKFKLSYLNSSAILSGIGGEIMIYNDEEYNGYYEIGGTCKGVLCPEWNFIDKIQIENNFIWNVNNINWNDFGNNREYGDYSNLSISMTYYDENHTYIEKRSYEGDSLEIIFYVDTISQITSKFIIRYINSLVEDRNSEYTSNDYIIFQKLDISPYENNILQEQIAKDRELRKLIENTAIAALVIIILVALYFYLKKRGRNQ